MIAEEYRSEIESIKSFIQHVELDKSSVPQILQQKILQHFNRYKTEKNSHALLLAVLHILAFVELGFSYETNYLLFDCILFEYGKTRESLYSLKRYPNKPLSPTPSNLQKILAKWPPYNNRFASRSVVLADMQHKISAHIIGNHSYHNGYDRILNCSKYRYELLITKSDCYFYDHQKNFFYTLSIPEN